ncbi:MAG: sortase [Oscillospiraceae bacterium]|nr:sortase [Oscillospiraceae bacterium]
MPKKSGIVLVLVGAVLILSALLLYLFNANEDKKAGEAASSALEAVQTVISEKTAEEQPSSAPAEEEREDPVVFIDGYEYVGVLELPTLGLKLPIMDNWNYQKLELAPCRQFGSFTAGGLVIAGHNYQSHFARLTELESGQPVLFTNMNGEKALYAVEKLSTLASTAVDEVQNSGYDLVLYTCTYDGKRRVTVFCSRQEVLTE